MRGQRHAPAALYPRERAGTHCTGGWVGPGLMWTGAENLVTTEIRSPDRPARSKSLYRLSYRGPQTFTVPFVNGHLHWLQQILGHIASLCTSYHSSVILTDKHNTIPIYCFYSALLHVSALYIGHI